MEIVEPKESHNEPLTSPTAALAILEVETTFVAQALIELGIDISLLAEGMEVLSSGSAKEDNVMGPKSTKGGDVAELQEDDEDDEEPGEFSDQVFDGYL